MKILDKLNQLSRVVNDLKRRSTLTANEQHDGLMSAADYHQIGNAALENLPDKTDILTTKPGRYTVYNPENSPLINPSRFFLDVQKNSRGDRIIKATALYTGITYHYIVRGSNSNPDTPNQWVSDISTTPLWMGSVKGVGKSIVLADDAGRYSGLLITYKISSTVQTAFFGGITNTDQELYVPNDDVLTGFNVNMSTISNTIEMTRIGINVTEKNLKITFFKDYSLNMDHMVTTLITDADADYAITTVVGIK